MLGPAAEAAVEAASGGVTADVVDDWDVPLPAHDERTRAAVTATAAMHETTTRDMAKTPLLEAECLEAECLEARCLEANDDC